MKKKVWLYIFFPVLARTTLENFNEKKDKKRKSISFKKMTLFLCHLCKFYPSFIHKFWPSCYISFGNLLQK